MMVEILSQIVEFRNGESGSHVLNINILTGMILESLVQKTDKYNRYNKCLAIKREMLTV